MEQRLFWPVLCRKCNLVIKVWCCRVFQEKRKTVATPCISFSLIIVKSLQLRGHRQIAEPHKYRFVHVIVFPWHGFSLFFVSHKLRILS